MDRADPTIDSLHALELRVLEGPQRGARAPLSPGQACVLAVTPDGAADGADIVLRSGTPARVRVSVDVPHGLLEVMQGDAKLGDDTHAAGAQTLWTMHAPLRLGDAVVAFGRASEETWPEATGTPDAAAAADAAAPVARTPWRRRAEVWLAAMGAGVLLACGGAFWVAHAAAAPRTAPAVDAVALADALRGSEFAGLKLAAGADGALRVSGRVATDEQRRKLDAWLAERAPRARAEVIVDEAIAHDVTEVFRVNGVAVKAVAQGDGRIAAEAAERDPERLKRATEVVRRDVRGLEALTVQNTARPLPPPAPPVSDDPGKRIASLVPGDPAYLVTADGSRYFVGALLPSGHRVTQIAPGSVTLELHGQQTTLNF